MRRRWPQLGAGLVLLTCLTAVLHPSHSSSLPTPLSQSPHFPHESPVQPHFPRESPVKPHSRHTRSDDVNEGSKATFLRREAALKSTNSGHALKQRSSTKKLPTRTTSRFASQLTKPNRVKQDSKIFKSSPHPNVPINFDIDDLNDDLIIQKYSTAISSDPNNSHSSKGATDKTFQKHGTFLVNSIKANQNVSVSQKYPMVSSTSPDISHSKNGTIEKNIQKQVSFPINSAEDNKDSAVSKISLTDDFPNISAITKLMDRLSSEKLKSNFKVTNASPDHVALHVSTNEVLLNNIETENIHQYIGKLVTNIEEDVNKKSKNETHDTQSDASLLENTDEQKSYINGPANTEDKEDDDVDIRELVKVFRFFESVDWHEIFSLVFPSQHENDSHNNTNIKHAPNSNKTVDSKNVMTESPINQNTEYDSSKVIDQNTLHDIHDILISLQALNSTDNAEVTQNFTQKYRKFMKRFSESLQNTEHDEDDVDCLELLEIDTGPNLPENKIEDKVNKTTDKFHVPSSISKRDTSHEDLEKIHSNNFKERCANIRGRSNARSSNDMLRSRILFDLNDDQAIRRMSVLRDSGLGGIETLLRFNDRFLPLPFMHQEEPRTDLLSSLINVANPLPYMMESWSGMRNMFNQKMEPVMNFYDSMNIEARPPLTAIMNAFSPRVRSPPAPQFLPPSFQAPATIPFRPQVQVPAPAPLAPAQFQFPTQPIDSFPLPLSNDFNDGLGQFPPFADVTPSGGAKDIISNTGALDSVSMFENFDVIHTKTQMPNSLRQGKQRKKGKSKINKILNIKIPTDSGKSPVFEISLMEDGNIGILPVDKETMRPEVPTIALENMFSMAKLKDLAQQSDEKDDMPNLEVVETAPRQQFPSRNIGKVQQNSRPLKLPTAMSAVDDAIFNQIRAINRQKSLDRMNALRHHQHQARLNPLLRPSLGIPNIARPPSQLRQFNILEDDDKWFVDHHMMSDGSYEFPTQLDLGETPAVSNGHIFKTDDPHHSLIDPFDLPHLRTRYPLRHQYPDFDYNDYSRLLYSPYSHVFPTLSPELNSHYTTLLHENHHHSPAFQNENSHESPSSQEQSASITEPQFSSSSPSISLVTSENSLVNSHDSDSSSKSSPSSDNEANVYYIDITIPDTFGGASIKQWKDGHKKRSKRDAKQPSNSGSSGDRMTRVIQYTGWQPVDLNNPLNNQPTVSYKPPPLQKVHFGKEPPSTKPLYPILPENPPVYVLRENNEKPEIDEIYGTEKVEYMHIEPKSNTVRAFKPAGKARVVKLVKRLDSVEGSDLMKRSPASPIDLFGSPWKGPNYDISNFNFTNSQDGSPPDLDFAFSENEREVSIPHPLLRLLPRLAQASDNPRIANGRGLASSKISPEQLLQARLNLARLPLMSPLHGLFGSFTQIPLGGHPKRSGLPAGDTVVQEVPAPRIVSLDQERLQPAASEQIGAVLFSRSQQQKIDRADPTDYLVKAGKIDRTVIGGKSRFRSLQNKQARSKTLAANSLSELLQIFRHINVTEPPPTPTTTPPPVTIMKGFRYTKPTEPPVTTTTTRPTTTKRFRLPTAVRYLAGQPKKSYKQNVLTTTAKPFTTEWPVHQVKSLLPVRSFVPFKPNSSPQINAAQIKIKPALTPQSSKLLTGASEFDFDNVAETNSLDGYLFSDSETSPEYVKNEDRPSQISKFRPSPKKVITPLVIPKALSSKRVSVRVVGGQTQKGDIVHTKNSKPLKSEFEIIHLNKPKTTTAKPIMKSEVPFKIIEGHSQVKVFRFQPSKKPNVLVSETPALSTNYEITNTTSSKSSHSTVSINAHVSTSTPNSTDSKNSSEYDENNSPVREKLHLFEKNYYNYDYYRDLGFAGGEPSDDYVDYSSADTPTYSLRRPWTLTENPENTASPSEPNRDGKSLDSIAEAMPLPPPPLHFLEGLRQSLPTSVPTTWQDLDLSASEISSKTITVPAAIVVNSEPVDSHVTRDGESQSDTIQDSTSTTGEDQTKSQQSYEKYPPNTERPEEGFSIASIIESIVTEPFESRPS